MKKKLIFEHYEKKQKHYNSDNKICVFSIKQDPRYSVGSGETNQLRSQNRVEEYEDAQAPTKLAHEDQSEASKADAPSNRRADESSIKQDLKTVEAGFCEKKTPIRTKYVFFSYCFIREKVIK